MTHFIKLSHLLRIITILLGSYTLGNTATLYSITNGNWVSTGSWSYTSGGSSCSCIPQAGDFVSIEHTITIASDINLNDGSNPTFIVIQAAGLLDFDGNIKLQLAIGSIIELATGGQITTDDSNANDRITIGNTAAWRSRCNAGYTPPNCGSVTGAASICLDADGDPSSTCTGVPLPTGFLILKGKFDPSNQWVQLQWFTAESKKSVYNVERSTDGKSFEIIKVVNGASTNIQAQQFVALDKNSPEGIIYYRIKQTTTEGKEYSKTIVIATEQNYQPTAYPNPSKGNFQLLLPHYKGEISLSVYNMLGINVYNKKSIPIKQNEAISLNLPSDMPPGTYLMQVMLKNQTHTLKLFIE